MRVVRVWVVAMWVVRVHPVRVVLVRRMNVRRPEMWDMHMLRQGGVTLVVASSRLVR